MLYQSRRNDLAPRDALHPPNGQAADTRAAIARLENQAQRLRDNVEKAFGAPLKWTGLAEVNAEVPSGQPLWASLRDPLAYDGARYVPTGLRPALWRLGTSYHACPHHSHEGCRGSPHGDLSEPDGPVHASRWCDPRCQFVDGEYLHCAHRELGLLKRQPRHPDEPPAPACWIHEVDERLCCRCCALDEVCCSESRLYELYCSTGEADLGPPGQSGQVAAKLPALGSPRCRPADAPRAGEGD